MITLGIIGVVAAMTLPTLVAKYQKAQTVSQLKKAYSELNQAIRIAEAEHGTLDSWDFTGFTSAPERNKYFSENYLLPNIKRSKTCIPSSEQCWSSQMFTLDGNVHTVTGNSSAGGHFSFVTPSGYSVYYWLHSTGDGGWFYIDINGSKTPNTLGKDIFIFRMNWGNLSVTQSKLGLNPRGLEHTGVTRDELINGRKSDSNSSKAFCTKDTGVNGAGASCAALIMMDGWEIKNDYPW